MTTATGDVEAILRHTVTCHTRDDLVAKLKRGAPLRVKLGVDPSSPDLHLGHAVQLRYLRRLQRMGHRPVLIIGEATAMVGDPTGKNTTRPVLSREQVEQNAATYLAQAGLILDLDEVEIVRNSAWFDRMTFMDAIRMGTSTTVARMLERDTFDERYKAGTPIGIHEFFYPLMQGHDSVEVRADVEIGGTDQTFNLLVGRDLMRAAGQDPQVCITLPIIVGLDGVQKMSKSLGNSIGLTDPPRDVFGKTMSLPDAAMGDYFRLLTDLADAEIEALLAGSPRDAKATLAERITAWLHGEAAGREAAAEFDRIFRDKGLPDEIPESELPADLVEPDGAWIVRVMQHLGLASSGGEARRLLKGGGVRVDDRKVDDENHRLPRGSTTLLQVGRRRFHRIRVP
ncbi:MAG: tyrosine--tRNA ligase [Planctomycetes bacterium]|nr:tyrosine--tRNA ligase [Planctomycetota bacterium]